MNIIQQRFNGFLETPVLWRGKDVYGLAQFNLEQKTISFDAPIDVHQRLGKYVERFVSYQLLKADGLHLLAENIQIAKDKITLGELDCLLLRDGKPIHLEVVYKFYLFDSSEETTGLKSWIGPNRKDSLIEKLDKLKHKQLPLLYLDECREYLQTIDLKVEDITQQVYFKAQLFVPLNMDSIITGGVNADCVAGFYLNQEELKSFQEVKFYIPHKKDWLLVPHTDVNWLNYEDFLQESKPYLERQFSPMFWMKTATGELKKFFLVWW